MEGGDASPRALSPRRKIFKSRAVRRESLVVASLNGGRALGSAEPTATVFFDAADSRAGSLFSW